MGVAVMISWCGWWPALGALLAQTQALVHTEAVLLINDDQREGFETPPLSWNSACVPITMPAWPSRTPLEDRTRGRLPV